MSIKSIIRLIIFTLIPIGLLTYIAIVSFEKMKEFTINVPNTLIYTLVVMLLVFLLILIIRFFFLLTFSFADSMESINAKFERGAPLVSILVPAYNEGKVIEKSLEALSKLNYPNFEIIVINDGSTDDTFIKASAFSGKRGNCQIQIISKSNTGKADSLNRGLLLAKGELILAVDADSKLTSKSLKMLVRHFKDPSVGAVAGNVKVVNRNNFWTRLQALEYIEGLNLVRRAQGFLRIVNIIPGPLGMFRKRVIRDVGGYSKDTFAEDCDLTLKILSRNWKIKYESSAISYTEAPENLMDIFTQRYRWTRGIIQSVNKHIKKVFFPFRNFSTSFTLWMLIFESLLWPFMNVLSNMFLIFVAIKYNFAPILVLWWCLLTILDIAIALHCVAIEDEDYTLIIYSVLYRLFYIFVIDFCKIFAFFEEALGFKMFWGKVARKGRL